MVNPCNEILFSNKKKKKEGLSHKNTWRNLKSTLLKERSQSHKATHCMIPLYGAFWKRQNHEPIKRSLGLKDLGVGGRNE